MRADDNRGPQFRNIRNAKHFFEVPSNDAWLLWWSGVAVSVASPVLALVLLFVAVLVATAGRWLH